MDKCTVSSQKDKQITPSQSSDNPELDKFAEILAGIQASPTALEGQIGVVQSEGSLVWQDLRNVVDRVTETEGRVSELEDTVKERSATVQRLSSTTGALEARAEDA